MPDELRVDIGRSDTPVIRHPLSAAEAAAISDAQTAVQQLLQQQRDARHQARTVARDFLANPTPTLLDVLPVLRLIINYLALDKDD